MGQFTADNFAFAPAVPEPATILLLGSGLALMTRLRPGLRRAGRKDA
jgi:hypothetical protein